MKKQFASGILLSLLGFATASQQSTGRISINPSTRLMQDASNRTMILHGVNIVPKTHPYIPRNDTFDPVFSLTEAEIKGLSEWGFNVVRLGIMWQAVEVAPGVYNETYMDEMEALINKMGSYGIYSLVDGHQDAVSNNTCGEGFPNFYTQSAKSYCDGGYIPWMMDYYGFCYSIRDFGYRFTPEGKPYVEDCRTKSFAEYYMTAESLDIMEQLYTNHSSLQNSYIAYWKYVSARLAGNPYIVGYDPLNEPFPSNVYKDPEIVFEPGLFDERSLEPLYSRTYLEAYKPADAGNMMFFEAAEFPDEMGIFGGLVFNLGFTKPPGGEMNSAYHVVNDHTYCFQLVNSQNPLQSYGRNNTQCRLWHEDRIGTRAQDAKRYGVPLFISEFGGCGEDQDGFDEITMVGEVCDEHLSGWAYWQFKNFNDPTTSGEFFEGFYHQDGTLQTNKLKALTRTYLPLTQGELVSMAFSVADASFKAQFRVNTGIQQPSVLYYSQEYWYPHGISVKITDTEGKGLDMYSDYTLDVSEANYAKITVINAKYNGQVLKMEVQAQDHESIF
ncbi:hypothetical protein FGO68_gene10517 [Halteria grandinella]|uniref:Endoglycoceramidase n=1 Tax=Halteria grandinella TaxID=5974 RepID=A0A8J8NTU3_HALGN|nr:hypothetical protein FGO68_gene10517 [Halteria grandinella]